MAIGVGEEGLMQRSGSPSRQGWEKARLRISPGSEYREVKMEPGLGRRQ